MTPLLGRPTVFIPRPHFALSHSLFPLLPTFFSYGARLAPWWTTGCSIGHAPFSACLPACLHVAYFNSSNQPHRVTCWFFWKMCCAKMMMTTTGEKRRRRRKGRQAIFHQRATRNRRQHGPIDNTPYAAAAVGKRARHAYWGENAMGNCNSKLSAENRCPNQKCQLKKKERRNREIHFSLRRWTKPLRYVGDATSFLSTIGIEEKMFSLRLTDSSANRGEGKGSSSFSFFLISRFLFFGLERKVLLHRPPPPAYVREARNFRFVRFTPKHLPSWSRCAARLVNSKWIGNKWVFGYLVPCRVLSPTKKRTNIGGTYPSLSAGRGLVTTRFYLYTFMLLLVFRFFAHVALGTLLFFSLFLVAFFLSFLFFLFHHPFCLGPYSIHSV